VTISRWDGTAANELCINQPADGIILLSHFDPLSPPGLLSEAGVSLNDFTLVACMVMTGKLLLQIETTEVSSL